MAKRGRESDYERHRQACIAENQARMEMLGLRRAAQELNVMAAAPAPARRPWTRRQYGTGPLRQSARLKDEPVQHQALPLTGCLSKVKPVLVEEVHKEQEQEQQQQQQQEEKEDEEEGQQQQAQAAPAAAADEEVAPAPNDSDDEGMGAVYDPVPGSPVHPAGGGDRKF
ncbi:hypothetical protein EJB05_04895, partial [Eragrostis curvula]